MADARGAGRERAVLLGVALAVAALVVDLGVDPPSPRLPAKDIVTPAPAAPR